jgi:glycosyltransferase involved in cell wall biosynthesis
MRHVLSAVMFFPRGGSAHLARGLAERLPEAGWTVRLVAGSRPELGPEADARVFYRGLDVVAVEFDHGEPDETAGSPAEGDRSEVATLRAPLHPSFEDRPDAPDPVFASLDDQEYERHVAAWARALESAGAASADILHLHHLTPLNEAAARVAPAIPVVGELHGTELLMLERIAAGNPDGWAHADAWRARLLAWAGRCRRLIVAPGARERASSVLGVDNDVLRPIPNGYDERRFAPREVDRAAHWHRHLVAEPRGWLPERPPGSVSYGDADLAPLRDGVVFAYVGRFTEVKRMPLLIHAFAAAEARFRRPAALVLIGGYPGEWEGEHPAETIRAVGARSVFLAGWHPHDALPDFFAASDAVVLTSSREQFGQILVEGMACGLPAVATRSFGPSVIVDDGRTGWLVDRDDEPALVEALVQVVNDEDERRRRGAAASEAARTRFSWPAVVAQVADVFAEAVDP